MLCAQLAAAKWCTGARKGVELDTVLGGLIMPERRQTEEIRVDAPLETDFFFKNQAGKFSGYSEST
jgi:hypothetical protein